MKFELVEPPEPEEPRDVPAEPAEMVYGGAAEDASGEDPVAALTAATERLSADVAAEAERIDASLAELDAALAGVRPAWAAAAGPLAPPPAGFRADRFGAGRPPPARNGNGEPAL
ncbi:hypothetical protein [Actinomadura fibrosa]|uniref:Uncharacterized protein n=1 Tax=Actinomadura fibrosa TaxID=111802 RepID=A0ABW2XR85_9ACTN|nr:hypothetical protein [Actinomadura fibrosa]